MSKFAIGLLTLAMYGTTLVVVPMVTPARAAADSSKEIKKNKKKTHTRSGIGDPRSSGQAWRPPTNYADDPDRKAAGGGGGY